MHWPEVELEVGGAEVAAEVDAVELAPAVEAHLDGGRLDRRRVDGELRQCRRQFTYRGGNVELPARTLEAVAAGEAPWAIRPAGEVDSLERQVLPGDGRRAVDADARVDGEVRPQTVHAGECLLRTLEDRTASSATACARAHSQRRGQQQERGFHASERTGGLSGPVPKVSA